MKSGAPAAGLFNGAMHEEPRDDEESVFSLHSQHKVAPLGLEGFQFSSDHDRQTHADPAFSQ